MDIYETEQALMRLILNNIVKWKVLQVLENYETSVKTGRSPAKLRSLWQLNFWACSAKFCIQRNYVCWVQTGGWCKSVLKSTPKWALLSVLLRVKPYPPIGLYERLACIHLGCITHLASEEDAVKTEKVQTTAEKMEGQKASYLRTRFMVAMAQYIGT